MRLFRRQLALVVLVITPVLTSGPADAAPAGAEPRPSARERLVAGLAGAETAEQVAGLLPVLDELDTRPGVAEDGELVARVADTAVHVGTLDIAASLYDRLVAEWPETHAVQGWYGRGTVHETRDERDAAIDAYQRVVALAAAREAAGDRSVTSLRLQAYARLGPLYEDAGRWAEALESWRAYRPTSWCGNCADALARRRRRAIARAWFHLGQVDRALDELWSAALETNNLHPWNDLRAVFDFIDLAVRVERLAEVHDLLRRLQPRARELAVPDARAAEAWLRRDPEGILAALAGSPYRPDADGAVPIPVVHAARWLADLGGEGRRVARRHLERGDLVAAWIVSTARIDALRGEVEALRRRLAGEDARTVAAMLEAWNEKDADPRD
ncbi:MAG: hypothetical protein Kow0062_09180 [Acidobacteriota bacterium]